MDECWLLSDPEWIIYGSMDIRQKMRKRLDFDNDSNYRSFFQ